MNLCSGQFQDTLNKVLTDLDLYPVPMIDSIFNKIGEGNKYFSSLDFHSRYWQIPINERDRHKTALTWKGQYYQYTCLAFSLTSAGQIFSRCITEALTTVTSQENILSYIDDNLIHTEIFHDYISMLGHLFITHQKFGLNLNHEKCTFLTPEAKFLSIIINK